MNGNEEWLSRCKVPTLLGLQLGRGDKKLGRGDASICSVYPGVTLYEVDAYAEHIRLTPYKLFSNKKNSL